MELYKLFVESADKNSERRMKQNNTYVTIELAIVSYIAAANIDNFFIYMISIIGLFIGFIWCLTIRNYSMRNKVKYQIINEYENDNNLNWYKEEEKRTMTLSNLSFFEMLLPLIFITIFLVILICIK